MTRMGEAIAETVKGTILAQRPEVLAEPEKLLADILPLLVDVIERDKLSIKPYPTFLRKILKPMLAQIRQEKREYYRNLSVTKRNAKLLARKEARAKARDIRMINKGKRIKTDSFYAQGN